MSLRTTSLRSVLRSGASLAALAAAWGLPQVAEAQTCSTGAVLDGVPAGTLVACPSGTQLDFPGAVVVGPFTVPNGSVLTGTLNGTSPTHRQFAYNDPNGNALTVFLQGFYDLRGGVGGATELQGSAILGLSGAGACGAGGQVCPGTPGAGAFSVANSTTTGGGGVGGGFALPEAFDPYASDTGPTSFLQVGLADLSGIACGGAPESCSGGAALGGSDFLPGYNFISIVNAASRSPTVTIDFHGAAPADRQDAHDACTAAGRDCIFVAVPDGTAPGQYHFGPVIDTVGTTYGATAPEWDGDVTIHGEGFADYIFTDEGGSTIYFGDFDTAVDDGRLGRFFVAHLAATQALAQNNDSNAGGAGVQGTFSIPGVDDRFIYSSFAGGDGSTYVVSFPLSSGEAATYLCDPGGCDYAMPIEVDPYDSELDQPPPPPPGRLDFAIVPPKGYEGGGLGSRIRLSTPLLSEISNRTTASSATE